MVSGKGKSTALAEYTVNSVAFAEKSKLLCAQYVVCSRSLRALHLVVASRPPSRDVKLQNCFELFVQLCPCGHSRLTRKEVMMRLVAVLEAPRK